MFPRLTYSVLRLLAGIIMLMLVELIWFSPSWLNLNSPIFNSIVLDKGSISDSDGVNSVISSSTLSQKQQKHPQQQPQDEDDVTSQRQSNGVPLTLRPSPPSYVVFSSTLDSFARAQDYDFLVPLVGRNWDIFGFHPIIIVVASNVTVIEETQRLWKIVLPKVATVIPIVVDNSDLAISVSQISRLYGAALVPDLDDESFIRLTDADVMILDYEPFKPPEDHVDITLFNAISDETFGRKYKAGNRTCNQYPIHSAGMKAGLWKKLFPLNVTNRSSRSSSSSISSGSTFSITTTVESLGPQLLADAYRLFPSFKDQQGPTKHNGIHWRMDQILLGCAIDDATEAGYNITLAPGPSSRAHIKGKNVVGGDNILTDAHLAAFSLMKHFRWLDNFLNQTNAIRGHETKYLAYRDAWMEAKNIKLPV